jgi:hypothetical protein
VAPEVTTGQGVLTRAEIAGRCAAATGRDVSALGYYMAFGCFKLAWCSRASTPGFPAA